VFEVAIKAEYEAFKTGDEGTAEKGSLRVFEVYQDDIEDDFEVRTRGGGITAVLRCQAPACQRPLPSPRRPPQVRFAVTKAADGVDGRAACRGPLAAAVRGVVRDFAAKLPEMDGGEAALAEAKVRPPRPAGCRA